MNLGRLLIAALMLVTLSNSSAASAVVCERSFVEIRVDKDKNVHEKSLSSWIAAARALEKKVIKIVGKGPGGLYMPFCWEASHALKRLLESEYGLKTTHVEALISSSFGDTPGTHYFLKVPDFFGKGDHLYIDPTLQQFGTNYVKPPIFVGSRSELERFMAERGALEGFPNFVRDYVAGKSLRSTAQ
ncbi:MAG: hypothetical protein U1E10_09035 [Bdellovibrionales bacterium]|nr:hypothetical protein [Bdellovibrionales bacterium]